MNQFQHALRERPWHFQRQAVALSALGIFIAILIGALYLAQSASVATLGRQLEDLIAQRNQLEQTNELLRSDISQLRSVPRLLARAQELGFSMASEADIEYLYVAGYVANREPEAVAVSAQTTQRLPAYDESFTGWLQQQWDLLTAQISGFSGGG